jgi:hypothetical protein
MKQSALQKAIKKLDGVEALIKDNNGIPVLDEEGKTIGWGMINKEKTIKILEQMELDMLEEFKQITDDIFKLD